MMSEEELEVYTKEVLGLAACIRRAYNGPMGGGLQPHISREHPYNEYYWHTREACHTIARRLSIFFPDVIGQYEHKTVYMGER
jgi:hypothetical protein